MPGDKKLVQERVEIPKKGDAKIDEARGKSINRFRLFNTNSIILIAI